MPSRASGPADGPLPSVALGAGGGQGTGRLDRVARPAGSIRPHYPPRARQRGEEADVMVDVWIGALGDVDRVAVSRSAGPEFDAAALAAVEKARFHPALRDGKPVPSRVALRLHFRLER
jgi:TonB family protein